MHIKAICLPDFQCQLWQWTFVLTEKFPFPQKIAIFFFFKWDSTMSINKSVSGKSSETSTLFRFLYLQKSKKKCTKILKMVPLLTGTTLFTICRACAFNMSFHTITALFLFSLLGFSRWPDSWVSPWMVPMVWHHWVLFRDSSTVVCPHS